MKRIFSFLVALILVSSSFGVTFAQEDQGYLQNLVMEMIAPDEVLVSDPSYNSYKEQKDQKIDEKFDALSIEDQNKVIQMLNKTNRNRFENSNHRNIDAIMELAKKDWKSLLDLTESEWEEYEKILTKPRTSFRFVNNFLKDCPYRHFPTWLPYKDIETWSESKTGWAYRHIWTDKGWKEFMCDYEITYIGGDFKYVWWKTWRARRVMKLIPEVTGVHATYGGLFTDILIWGKADLFYSNKQDLLNEIWLWK